MAWRLSHNPMSSIYASLSFTLKPLQRCDQTGKTRCATKRHPFWALKKGHPKECHRCTFIARISGPIITRNFSTQSFWSFKRTNYKKCVPLLLLLALSVMFSSTKKTVRRHVTLLEGDFLLPLGEQLMCQVHQGLSQKKASKWCVYSALSPPHHCICSTCPKEKISSEEPFCVQLFLQVYWKLQLTLEDHDDKACLDTFTQVAPPSFPRLKDHIGTQTR